MADEYVRTIKIETSGAETTVKSLRDEINSLRDALLNAEKGSDEYRDILEQLIKDQERLTDAMNAGKNGMKAAEGSYNSLVNKMAALKKVWRETADETERNKIGDQIKGIQDKLKGMDGSIHDFRRNVGNYADSIKEAFGAMGGAAKGMVGPINSVKAAFTGLSAHPLVAVLTALAALLVGGIAKGFKSSEEATNKLRVAFSGFQAIGDAVTKMFQGLAKIIGDVANGVINFADKLGLLGPKFKARQEMTKKQIELEKKERDSIVKTAQIEQEAADLREKASDEENYSISQRIEFLKQAQAKEEEGLQLEKEILEQKVNQLEAQLALTDSTGEELTKLNELKAKLIKVNSDISKSQTSANKEINALRKRGVQEAAQAQQQLLSLEKELLQQEYDLAVDGSEKQLKLARDIAAKDREIAISNAKAKIKDKETLNKQLLLIDEKYQRDLQNIETQNAVKQYERRQVEWDTRLLGYREGSSEYFEEVRKREVERRDLLLKAQKELKEKLESDPNATIASPLSGEMIDMTKLKNELAGITKEIHKVEDDYFNALKTETEQTNRIILEGTRPLSAFYSKQIEQIKADIDNMAVFSTDRWGEVVDQNGNVIQQNLSYADRLAAKEKELADATHNYWTAVISESERAGRVVDDLFYKDTAKLDVVGKLERDLDDFRSYNRQYVLEAANLVKDNRESILSNFERYFYDDQVKKLREVYNKLGQEMTDETFEMIRKQAKIYAANAIENVDMLATATEEDLGRIEKNLGRVITLAGEGTAKMMEDGRIELEEALAILFQSSVLPEEFMDQYLSNFENMVDTEKELLRQRVENWTELADNIADLMGGIGNVWETSLENEKRALEKEGKYTDAERKLLEKKYKVVQAIQIAEATINTISGALGAFMGITKDSGGWAIAFAAAQAAAVTAAGVAQIMKIKQTNPYSDNSNSLGNDATAGMSATVIPQVSDYTPDYGVNLTNREDTEYLQEAIGRQRIWVSVSEIDRVQNRVNVAEKEAQF